MFSLDQNFTEINPDNSKSCSCNFTRTTSLYFSSFSRCIIGKLLSQVWVAKRNVGKKLEDIPAPLSDVKNILKKIEFKDETTRSRCRGWLVLPSRKYLQADILFPGCAFDCRLHIRGRIGTIFCYEYVSGSITLQWNLDLTKCQGTGEIRSLNRGFVISNTSIWRILGKTIKMFVIWR